MFIYQNIKNKNEYIATDGVVHEKFKTLLIYTMDNKSKSISSATLKQCWNLVENLSELPKQDINNSKAIKNTTKVKKAKFGPCGDLQKGSRVALF